MENHTPPQWLESRAVAAESTGNLTKWGEKIDSARVYEVTLTKCLRMKHAEAEKFIKM